jgi:hypothetical protein
MALAEELAHKLAAHLFRLADKPGADFRVNVVIVHAYLRLGKGLFPAA